MNRIAVRIMVIALGVAWLLIGGSKLYDGHRADYSIGPLLFYSAALIEIGMGACLLLDAVTFACFVGICICALGILIAFLLPSAASCGCLGPIGVLKGRGPHILAGAIGGIACSLTLWATRRIQTS